jgi:hypothetical protein
MRGRRTQKEEEAEVCDAERELMEPNKEDRGDHCLG